MSVPFDLSRCVICQKNQKPSNFYFCILCAKEYGTFEKPFSAWPAWVKPLTREYDKWQRRRKSATWIEEVPYDPNFLNKLIENEQG